MIEYLLSHGADPEANIGDPGEEGRIIDLARAMADEAVIRLLERGCRR